MSGPGEFAGAIDGLREVEEVHPQYRHDALEVFAGVFEDRGATRAVELRAVPAGAGSTARDAFTGVAQSWWSVSDLDGVVDLLRWGVEPRPWVLVADDGGETLATAWETIDDGTATDTVTAVGETLAAASTEGVMHGNLRPAHVRLPEGAVLVDDWGVGRAVAEAGGGAFVTGFTAPEQLDGSATDGAAVDTYGLAAVAYFVLTERPPFPEQRAAVLGERPQPVSAFRPDLPGAVDDLVMRGLRRDPDERPDGPGAFAAEFRDAMAGEGGGTAAGGAAAGGAAAGGATAGAADAPAGDEPTDRGGSVAGEENEDGDGVGGAVGGAAAGGAAGGTAEASGEDQGAGPSGATGAAGGAGPDDTGAESSPDPGGDGEAPGESASLPEEDAGPLAGGGDGPPTGDDSGPLAGESSGPLAENDPEPPVAEDTGPLVDDEPGPPAAGAGATGDTDARAEESGSRVNRRTVLAGGGLLAALAAVGAGAWAVLGGGSGDTDLSVVPDRAETIAAIDVAGLRESEAPAGALNARLPLSLPLLDADRLSGVLDGVATRTGMDPGGVQEAVFFAARSAGPETYAAAVLETEWDGAALPANLEGAAEAVSEETYADSRLLVAEYSDLTFPVAVGEVNGGRYAVGTRGEVEDVLETASGSTPPVEGREVEAFRAAVEGQLRLGSLFPADVVSAALPGRVPEQVAAALTETARNVEYVSGSVGADGSLRLEAETGSGEAAETAAAQLRAASTLAADELAGTDAEGPLATVVGLLEEASVSREETTVTVALDGAYELLAAGLAAAE